MDEKETKLFSQRSMKTILPTLKERNRYLVYKVDKTLKFDEVKEIINKNTLRFLGEFELAKANMMILNEYKKNKGIIKVNNLYTDKIRSSLILIKEPVFETIGISGTLKKARLKFLKEEG